MPQIISIALENKTFKAGAGELLVGVEMAKSVHCACAGRSVPPKGHTEIPLLLISCGATRGAPLCIANTTCPAPNALDTLQEQSFVLVLSGDKGNCANTG